MIYLIYDTTTGQIKRTGASVDPLLQATEPGEDVLVEEADQRTEYVDLNTLTVDPKAPATFAVDKDTVLADGLDEVQLLGLDVGDEVTVVFEGKNIDYFIYGPGDDALTFNDDGPYTLHVRSLYKLEKEITVDAT